MRAAHSAAPDFAVPYGRLFVSAMFQGVDWFTLTKSAFGTDVAIAVLRRRWRPDSRRERRRA
jgi:hypothetical protein